MNLRTSSWPHRRVFCGISLIDVLKFITHCPTDYESILIYSLNCDQSAWSRLILWTTFKERFQRFKPRTNIRTSMDGSFGAPMAIFHSNTWNNGPNRFMLWCSWISHDLLIAVCVKGTARENSDFSLVDLVAGVWSWCDELHMHCCPLILIFKSVGLMSCPKTASL